MIKTIKYRISIEKLFIIIFLFSGILPAFRLSYVIPVQYLFMPILIFIIFWYSNSKIDKRIIYNFIIFFLLCAYVLIDSIIIGSIKMHKFVINLDFVPYLFKLITFIAFFFILYKSKSISYIWFIKIFLYFALFAILITFLQWIPSPVSNFFVKIYAYKQTTIDFATRELLWTKRVQGFAMHPTSSGGIFAFFYLLAFYTLFILKNNKCLSFFVLIMSLIGTAFLMQARMGLITIIFTTILIIIFQIRTYNELIKRFIKILLFILFLFLILYYLYHYSDNIYIKQFFYRWKTLFNQSMSGENRIGQIKFAINHINSVSDLLFGISRIYQQSDILSQKMLIEVEPFYIFIIYGLFGLIFAYLPLFYLINYFKYLIKKLKYNKESSELLKISTISILSYLFFSLGYYFYRENYIPLISWIFWGGSLGIVYKNIHESYYSSKSCSSL